MPKFINRAQVLERLGNRSVSWLYEQMGAGLLPRPVKLGRSGVVWVESEIDDYIANRIAEGRASITARIRKKSAETPAAA